jgi:general secretion pathway protein M
MTESLKIWWRGHSQSERRLMTLLGVLMLGVFLWLGVWRPIGNGMSNGWARQSAALDRYSSVKAKVEALKTTRGAPVASGSRPALDQFVGQTATEAGFTLDRASAQGGGRLSINIASARMGPLLSWLSRLEASGISVQSIGIVPGSTDGTVTVQALLQENAQ